jgi:hypothetical protein
MSSVTEPNRHPLGLPVGTVRGFISVLICSFFWIFLLVPDSGDPTKQTAPLAHFFMASMVFLAFVSHPIPNSPGQNEWLPWLMRALVVGGSLAVFGFIQYSLPDRIQARLKPDTTEIGQWPMLSAALFGGFAVGMSLRSILRWVLGQNSGIFQTFQTWEGVICALLLVAETVFQFGIRPYLNDPGVNPEALKIWEGVLLTAVALYFGTRA